jgi:hypothetical protein
LQQPGDEIRLGKIAKNRIKNLPGRLGWRPFRSDVASLALFGRDAISDLSPEFAPKRTFAKAFDPRKKVGRGEVNSRAP